MPTIYDNIQNIDQTIRIFDGFYQKNIVVNAGDFDIVYGYFSSVCDTKKIAGNFTSVLFMIAQDTGNNVLDLLAIIKGSENKLQMNQVICYYLNSLKSKSALFGVGIIPQANQPAARNVVQ